MLWIKFIILALCFIKDELSRAYPLVSLGYVFTLLLGHFLLNESVTCNKIIGVFFIMVGVYFISRM